ncbi:MAG: flagellar biosynthetic protein FliO [Methylomonas sp.]|jgi:flagellar protein FliO/FliZ|uniref:flagellar biosynthetic protein FliO n=1 Tax=Methylomonas sp. TaxID=418 RepID=UPI0025ED9F68|nr:flagellar biosynthetic protein FliO [Methylomonas sp.]MCK9607128.1 flagellar biosynthetic protein FliO [Methylomonas sp.]
MRKAQLLVFFLAMSTVMAGSAEDAGSSKHAAGIVSYTDVLQWLLALLIVLVLFGGFIWLLRKSGSLSFAGKSQMSVISGLSVGVREKLVLVKVGEKQLLLGVTPGRIDKLLELEGDARLFQNQETPEDGGLFAQKLQQVQQGKSNV